MRKIKFRGRAMGGSYVYGLLTMKKIRSSGELVFAIAFGSFTGAETVPVVYESVAQFVGYDVNGREVYEGDICLDELENEHKITISFPRRFLATLVLKEAA